jgi:uncharacterized protein (DUF2249 family)
LPPVAGHLTTFDVRPILARGEHPLDEALRLVDAMAPGDELELFAPFEPRPLMERLRGRGCEVTAELHQEVWVVRAGKGGLLPLLELSDLPAPEPMERALEAVAALAQGAVLLARLPRHPVLLLEQLRARGVASETALRPDGTAVLWARRAS